MLYRRGARRMGGGSVIHQAGRNDGPPDLDELWRDFNRKLTGLFGNKGGGKNGGPQRGGDDRPPGGPFQPDMKSAGIGLGLIGVIALIAGQGNGQLAQRGLGIAHQRQGIVLVGIKLGHIQVDKAHVRVLKLGFAGRCKVAVAGANAND